MENYISCGVTALGALIALTNICVEVIKKAIPNDKFPTNLVAVLTAVTLTLAAFFGFVSYKGIEYSWYHIVAAVVAGILVSYGAMFGYDKLKEVLNGLKE